MKIVSDLELFEILKKNVQKRIMIAIAGAPASGKSTLAESLVERLNSFETGLAALAPMDGFHFDDAVLKSKNLFKIKGAPQTFDIGGFRHLLGRLKQNNEAEIAVPLFDRNLEISRAGARIIGQDVKIIVVEGNYLLLNQPPWNEFSKLYDITIFIEVPREILKQRLVQRWQSFDYSPAMIEQKLDITDMPNVDLIANESSPANYIIQSN